jgi:hypothetical protein
VSDDLRKSDILTPVLTVALRTVDRGEHQLT